MNLVARLRGYMGGEALAPILILFALNAVDEFDNEVFALLGPEISDSFGIGIGVFGSIRIGVILLVPFVSVPVAYLGDRWKRMPLAIMGAAAWGAFSLGTGLAPVLWLLVVMRVGSGFGKVVNEPIHGALIADFYSVATRAKAFGIHSLANTVGSAVAAVTLGFVAQFYGWRTAFFVLATPTFLALAIALSLREPTRGRHEVVEARDVPSMAETARRLWALRSLRYQWIGGAWTAGALLGISQLIPFFLEEEFNVQPGPRGVLLGVGTALAGVGVLVGTAFAQRKINESPSAGLRTLCWAGAVAGLCLFGLSVAPSLWVVMLFIYLILVIFAFVAPGLRAITAIIAPPELRSSAFALGGLIALAGAGFAVVSFFIGEQASIRVAIGLMAPVFLRGVMHFFTASRFIDNDVARLDPEVARRAREAREQAGPVLLETRGLEVSYDGVQVLFGVDVEIRRGEIVALLGTNGAGKSTTLNAISGLLVPDAGNVFFAGEAITGESPERTVARGIVQVPGGRGVFPGLTVAENLRMGGFLIRRDRALVSDRLDAVFELFPRLAERRGQRAGSLSGGERQMLTLGQSFLLQPELLLIDELSLGLAPNLVSELLAAVRRMNEQGITVMLVEQSVNIALNLADRAYFMEKGEVRFSGATADLLERSDLLRSVFLEGAGSGLDPRES